MSIISGETNDEELRSALLEITEKYIHERIAEQIPLIEALKGQHAHQISLVQEAIVGRKETFQFTCIQYAFNLTDPPHEVLQIATDHPDLYPSPLFVQYLIDNVLRELASPKDGCILVYSDGEKITHAGLMHGKMVVSKWGLAHTWRHRIYEVPSDYGSDVRFFEQISAEQSVQAFLQYANEKLAQRARRRSSNSSTRRFRKL